MQSLERHFPGITIVAAAWKLAMGHSSYPVNVWAQGSSMLHFACLSDLSTQQLRWEFTVKESESKQKGEWKDDIGWEMSFPIKDWINTTGEWTQNTYGFGKWAFGVISACWDNALYVNAQWIHISVGTTACCWTVWVYGNPNPKLPLVPGGIKRK